MLLIVYQSCRQCVSGKCFRYDDVLNVLNDAVESRSRYSSPEFRVRPPKQGDNCVPLQ